MRLLRLASLRRHSRIRRARAENHRSRGAPLNAKDRRKRLLVLADFLERDVLPRLDGAKFNMAGWGSTETEEKPASIKDTSACGFEGCAVGWAYYCPALVRAGIRRHVTWASWGMVVNDKTLASFFGLQWDINGDDELDEAFVPSSVSTIERGRTGLRKVVRRLRKIASRGVRRG